MKFMSNCPLSDEMNRKAKEILGDDNVLFAVVGDLKMDGTYGTSALVFGRDRVVAFDETYENGCKTVDYESIIRAKVKRLYGNAMFRVKDNDGKWHNLIRFSYAAADLGDAAAIYMEDVRDGGYTDKLLEAVQSTYEKMRSFCPKCGRKLPHPDAPCINCEGKTKTFSKLLKYVLPQKWHLVLCIVLSAFTTGL